MEQTMTRNVENKSYLLWIGVAAFICLLVLTVISLLDLRRDYSVPATAPVTSASAIAYPQVTIICPSCGKTGVAKCFYCGGNMQWNAGTGKYYCPGCGRTGIASCPLCKNQMTPLNQAMSPRGTYVAAKVATGYWVCKTCGYRMKAIPGVDPATYLCPKCKKYDMVVEYK